MTRQRLEDQLIPNDILRDQDYQDLYDQLFESEPEDDQLLVEKMNPPNPRHIKWMMFAKPCLTCDNINHCQRNCEIELNNLKDLAMDEPEYMEQLADFMAGMPFEYDLQGEVIGCVTDDTQMHQPTLHYHDMVVCTVQEEEGQQEEEVVYQEEEEEEKEEEETSGPQASSSS